MAEIDPQLDEVQRELASALAPGLHVLKLIGRGAMGAVFLARDPALKRHVVVKVLAPELADNPTARDRFAREAEMAAAVSHPNVISVFHVGELPVSRAGYFIMQYVDGRTLAEACPLGARVSQARARRVVGEIASALAAAHAQGLVHRDIKPTNVMLEGPEERVVVLDFGISAAASPERKASLERLTAQGTSIGTPEYMSPEQSLGGEVTDKSDVYSLGVVAFELLSGRAPFEATSAFGLAAAHVKDTPPRVGSLRPDVEPLFDALVARMLAKDPGARPSAAEVARTLLPGGAHTIEWPPPGLEPLRGRGIVALRWLVVASAALACTLLFSASLAVFSPAKVAFAMLAALVSVGLLCGGTIAVSVSASRLRGALRNGYPLRVGIDVLLDRRVDTGAMLNASGMYAAVSRERAAQWLALRRWAAAVLLGGSAATVVVATLWTTSVIGLSDSANADAVTFGTIVVLCAPIVVAVAIAVLLGAPERRARPQEHALRELRVGRLPPIAPELVSGWLTNAATDVPPTHRRASARVVRSTDWLIASMLVVSVGCLIATVTMGILHGFLRSPEISPARRRSQWRAEAKQAAAFGKAVDSMLARLGTASTLPLDLAGALGLLASRRNAFVEAGAVWSALRATPPAVVPLARAAFDSAAQSPANVAFRRFASGAPPPALWYAPSVLANDTTGQLLLMIYGPKPAPVDALTPRALDNAAAAVLALTRGDRADATRRAREILAVARALTRDPLPNVHRRGLGMAGLGARLLSEIAATVGDGVLMRESFELQQAIDARRAAGWALEVPALMGAAMLPGDTELVALAGNRALLPVDRWAAVRAIARGACWNSGEMRMGASPLRRAALRRAGQSIGDIEGSATWIALHERLLDRFERAEASASTASMAPPIIGRAKPFVRFAICETN